MFDYTLGSQELDDLRAAHRRASNVREAYRINAVLLLAQGRTVSDVADALLIDKETVRNYFKRYKQGGIDALSRMNHVGSEALLDEARLSELDAHLRKHLHLTAESVARWVEERRGIRYTASGMTAVLRRRGYVYKKPERVPGKANRSAREAHPEVYEKLEQDKGEHDPIHFMDAVHPRHDPVPAHGWIKRGEERQLPTDTGRRRLDINGVIDPDTLEPIVRYDETINAASTIALFQQIEHAHPQARRIPVICDNARYYRAKAVKA